MPKQCRLNFFLMGNELKKKSVMTHTIRKILNLTLIIGQANNQSIPSVVIFISRESVILSSVQKSAEGKLQKFYFYSLLSASSHVAL